MSPMVWMWAGIALWFAAAIGVSIVVGRVIRSRDQQVPKADPKAEPVRPEPVTTGERADGQP